MTRRPGPASPVQHDTTPLPRIHLARDHPATEVAARVRAGEWTRVRSGAYVEPRAEASASAVRRHLSLARLVALREQLSIPYVLSHESAALLWGLPVLRQPARTHLVQRSRPTSRGARDVIRHVFDVPEDQRTVHREHPVTTLERTVVDCAMTLGAHGGLVVADAALHVGADRAGCLAILAGMAGRHGAPTARAILDLADDGSESPGETSARFVLLRAGLPVPETQVAVSTPLGMFWTDLGWREWRLLAEYDGRLKYGAAGTASEVVVQEKRRQQAIEEAGWRVIRLTKEDLREPLEMVRRLARYLPPGTLDGLRPRSALNRTRARPASALNRHFYARSSLSSDDLAGD